MIHPKYHDEMGCSRSHTYWLSIFHDAQEAHVAAQGRDDSPASPIDVLSRGDCVRPYPGVPLSQSPSSPRRRRASSSSVSLAQGISNGGKERSKPRLSCHMVLVSSSRDPSTAGGDRIHVHAYARRALRSQVWCPLQAVWAAPLSSRGCTTTGMRLEASRG